MLGFTVAEAVQSSELTEHGGVVIVVDCTLLGFGLLGVLVALQGFFSPTGYGSAQRHISHKFDISALFDHDGRFLRDPMFQFAVG